MVSEDGYEYTVTVKDPCDCDENVWIRILILSIKLNFSGFRIFTAIDAVRVRTRYAAIVRMLHIKELLVYMHMQWQLLWKKVMF